ncbi:hypothetical protein [Rhodococcus sp. NPDC058639]|uniref:hypothetical protein n=1 Tax=Rhodococcus sp. NPDC058639 TaxID=3346570 RepID=UPI00364DDEF4
MTKVSDSSTRSGSLPDLVYPLAQTGSLSDALHVAGEGAVTLAQGSAAAGLVLSRQGLELTKNVVERVQDARREKAALAAAPRRRTAPRPGRKALVTTGALAAVVLGALALYRSRRPAHPPIAPEPPRVRPAAGHTAPATD